MSGMRNVDWKLDNFVLAMRYKLRLRAKRPPDPTKWPVDAVDANGDRDWLQCSEEFLRAKLTEETTELHEEVAFCDALLLPSGTDLDKLAFEAADVALVAFMIAERAGVDWAAVTTRLQIPPRK